MVFCKILVLGSACPGFPSMTTKQSFKSSLFDVVIGGDLSNSILLLENFFFFLLSNSLNYANDTSTYVLLRETLGCEKLS